MRKSYLRKVAWFTKFRKKRIVKSLAVLTISIPWAIWWMPVAISNFFHPVVALRLLTPDLVISTPNNPILSYIFYGVTGLVMVATSLGLSWLWYALFFWSASTRERLKV